MLIDHLHQQPQLELTRFHIPPQNTLEVAPNIIILMFIISDDDHQPHVEPTDCISFFLRNRSKVSFNLEEAKKALSGLVEQPTCLQLADARNHSIRSFFNCSLFQQTRRRTKASFLTLHPWNKTAKFLAYNNSWQLTDSSGGTDNSVHIDHFRSNRRAKHFQARDECILDNGQHNKI